MFGDKIIGEFLETEDKSELLADCSLVEPIAPASESLLLAIAFRPTLNIISVCNTLRVYRIVTEISISLYTD
jgi:hypothetical protein